MHQAIDVHIKEILDQIFREKERYQYELKVEKERRKTRAKAPARASAGSSSDTPAPPGDTQPPLLRADTQVVEDAAIQLAAEVLDRAGCVCSPSHYMGVASLVHFGRLM